MKLYNNIVIANLLIHNKEKIFITIHVNNIYKINKKINV